MLKQEGRGSTGSGEQARTRRVVEVIEFALSLMLMVPAGLLLRSFRDLVNVRLGFNPRKGSTAPPSRPHPRPPRTHASPTPPPAPPSSRHVLPPPQPPPNATEP